MRRDGNLELQYPRRGDLDFELCAYISFFIAPMGQRPKPRGGANGKPSIPRGSSSHSRVAPPSPSHIDSAAVISMRAVLRRTPARSMSVTVNDVRVATMVFDPPMSAWLPITRSSVMCVMTVSLSARASELLGGVRMPNRRVPESAILHGFAR